MLALGGFIFAVIIRTITAALPVETLSGQPLLMPRDARGPSVFVITFERAASKQAAEWTNALLKTTPPISVYQVAVLEGVPGFARSWIIGQIRRGVPETMRDHFLVASKRTNEWRDAAGFSAVDDAYLIFAMPEGQVLWRTHGKCTAAGLAEAVAAAR